MLTPRHAAIYAAFLLAASPLWAASAQRAQVLAAQPVQEQVGVPQQVCADEVEQLPAASGAPADAQPSYTTTYRCKNELVYENQTVGWDVHFQYAGQNHTIRMNQKPGAWIDVPAHLVAENTQKIAQNQKQNPPKKTAVKPKSTPKSNTSTASKSANSKTNPKTSPTNAPRNQWNSDTAADAQAAKRPKSRSVSTQSPNATQIQQDIENAAVIIAPPAANIPQGVNIYAPARHLGQPGNFHIPSEYPANQPSHIRPDGVVETWVNR